MFQRHPFGGKTYASLVETWHVSFSVLIIFEENHFICRLRIGHACFQQQVYIADVQVERNQSLYIGIKKATIVDYVISLEIIRNFKKVTIINWQYHAANYEKPEQFVNYGRRLKEKDDLTWLIHFCFHKAARLEREIGNRHSNLLTFNTHKLTDLASGKNFFFSNLYKNTCIIHPKKYRKILYKKKTEKM